MPHARYTSDEIVRRGQELYDRRVRARVEPGHRGEFLVLDIETGDYEIDPNEVTALRRAKAKNPNPALYILRVGAPTAYRIGAPRAATKS